MANMVNKAVLPSAMNQNLLALKSTEKLMSQTQTRLATGLKVNSALDDPNAYYKASSLNQRAGDLETLLDGMGQAVQTVQAASEAITGIESFVAQAKAAAQSARDTSDATERTSAAARFDAILTEINNLSKDAGYAGTNLLNSENLTVVFNEKSGADKHTYEITGYDASTTGLGIDAAGTDWDNTVAKPTDPTSATYAADLAAWQTAEDASIAAIDASIAQIEAAVQTLRSMSSDLGNSYSIVQAREEFTESLINVLTEGADKLTLADMNEESANMLALSNRQSLAGSALSLASQAAQLPASLLS